MTKKLALIQDKLMYVERLKNEMKKTGGKSNANKI